MDHKEDRWSKTALRYAALRIYNLTRVTIMHAILHDHAMTRIDAYTAADEATYRPIRSLN